MQEGSFSSVPSHRSGIATATLALVATVLLAASGAAQAASTHRVSVSSDLEQGNDHSGVIFRNGTTTGPNGFPAVSASGQLVAFVSMATDLTDEPTGGKAQVYLHDRSTGTTEMISLNTAGTNGGNSDSWRPSMTPDGRYIAFQSSATNIAPGDTLGKSQIFVHDREIGETQMVSVGSTGAADKGAFWPSISPDGQDGVFVAFASLATNLAQGPSGTRAHIYVYSQETSGIDLVSRASGAGEGGGLGNGSSDRPSITVPSGISAGNRVIYTVAFSSQASNLAGGDTNQVADAFVARKVFDGIGDPGGPGAGDALETERVSVSSSGAQGATYAASNEPSITGGGRYVAFRSTADLAPGTPAAASNIYVRDTTNDTTQIVSVDSNEASFAFNSNSPAAHFAPGIQPGTGTLRIAFVSATGFSTNSSRVGVHLRNQTAGTTAKASLKWNGSNPSSPSSSGTPAIAGRYVTFLSNASNLVAGDTNGVTDVFIRDTTSSAPATPDTSIESAPPTLTGSTGASFTYSATPFQNVNQFECSLDGAAFAFCPATGISFVSLADGPHTFAVRAVDPGGNPDATPATHAWTVDTSKPDLEFSATPTTIDVPQRRSREVTITLDRLNGSNGNVSFTASGLPDGVSASFSPNPATGTGESAKLTLSAATGAPMDPDYADVTITATPAGAAVGIAPRTVAIQVRVVPDCRSRLTLEYLDIRASCIFEKSEGVFGVNGSVDVNGLRLLATPLPTGPLSTSSPSTIEIDAAERTLDSSTTYVVSVGGDVSIPFHATDIDWDLGGTGTGPKEVENAQLTGLRKFFHGLPIERVKVVLTKAGEAIVTPTLKLGFWPFNALFGALTSTATFTASNDGGANFSGLELTAEKIEGVGVRLKDVNLKWQSGGNWYGKANIALLFVSPASVDGEFSIKSGTFDFLRAQTSTLNKPIGGSIFLRRLGFEAKGSPPLLRGDIELTAGPTLEDEAAIAVDGSVEARFGDPFRITVKGVASLADRFELAEVEARYASTGVFEIFGSADWDLRVGYMDIGVLGWVDGSVFNFEGSGRGCIRVKYAIDPCAGVAALVSSKAIAGCIELVYVSGGIAYVWDEGFDAFGGFGGCSLERFRPARPAALPAAAEAHSFTLPAGLPVAVVRVRGEGDAPAVTLRGPSGESLVVSPDQSVVTQGRLSGLMSIDNSTYLTIQRPGAGRWTVTPAEGTVPLAGVEVARGLPKPRVKATVTGKGRSRTLRWQARGLNGQQLTFAETGRDVRNVIKSTSKPRGSVRFDLAQGPGGKRKIVALVDQAGFPQASRDVASFKSPSTQRPAKPLKLRVTRKKGSRLVVGWQAPRAGGFRHAVYLTLGDGRRLLRIVGPKARKAAFANVGRRVGAKVKVAGLTDANGRGPAAKAALKPKKR